MESQQVEFEWNVLQRSDACQNNPRSKSYLPLTSAFTMQHVEKGALNISLDLSLLKISLFVVAKTKTDLVNIVMQSS